MTKKTKQQQQTQTNAGAIPILQRGCGWPILGGTYLYVPTGFNGTPIWKMVLCPTVPIPENFGLSAIGMVLKERTGSRGQVVYDLWDWIGEKEYPNFLDWLLEVQQLGFHQKVNPEHMQWISEESCYFPVHSKASYVDPTDAYLTRETHPHQPVCPANHEAHITPVSGIDTAGRGDYMHLGSCVGTFFSDVRKGSKPEGGSRVTVREMPSFSWDGFVRAPDVDLAFQPAAFMRIPIGRWATILKYADTSCHQDVEQDAIDMLAQLDEKFKRIKIVNMDGG